MPQDMTVAQVIADPLISELRKADGIAPAAFAQLMQSAARVQLRRTGLPVTDEQAVNENGNPAAIRIQ